MTANGKASEATVSALFKRPVPLPKDYGAHKAHTVHAHDHQGRDAESFRCSARFLCATCTDEKHFRRGTWFWGPECPRPVKTAARSGK